MGDELRSDFEADREELRARFRAGQDEIRAYLRGREERLRDSRERLRAEQARINEQIDVIWKKMDRYL